jgi:5-methyltetrahydrofolate corrinoid/iron sulfur protein methyltransferase
MADKLQFIAVAENIHCTLIRKVGGKFAKQLDDGTGRIYYKDRGEEKSVKVPQHFVESEDWQNGKVKHLAAAMYLGFYGEGEEKQSGIDYIHYWARIQEEYHGTYLDVNVDEFSTDVEEKRKLMDWLCGIVQEGSQRPLSVDSSNMDILVTGLEKCDLSRGKPMLNSVSLERPEGIELAKRFGTVVVAGATGEEAMPNSVEERVDNCKRLMDKLKDAGLTESDVFFDPLVFPVSVDKNNGVAVIDTVKELRKIYGSDIHFSPGLSNISYGMPNRKLINQVFTHLCALEGMDGGIVDPRHINEKVLNNMDTTTEQYQLAKDLVLGNDEFGMNYITASREGKV